MRKAPPIDHYEALFDKKYLRWFHLRGKPALVEIVSVERDVTMTLPGGAKSVKPLVHLNLIQGEIESIKPLVLNKTNGDSIVAATGTNKPSEWPGHQIVLYETKTRMADGTQGPCIRIRAKKEQADTPAVE